MKQELLFLRGLEAPPPPTEAVVRVRIVEALETASTPDAQPMLVKLAKGPADAPATREAKAALARLNQSKLP